MFVTLSPALWQPGNFAASFPAAPGPIHYGSPVCPDIHACTCRTLVISGHTSYTRETAKATQVTMITSGCMCAYFLSYLAALSMAGCSLQDSQHSHNQQAWQLCLLHAIALLDSRGLPPPWKTSVHQLPRLAQPQCILFSNQGYPSETSVQMPVGEQNLSAH
jgi:hypothetical protein